MVTFVGRPEIETLAAWSRWNEAGLARTAVEVPLADETRAVAGLAQKLGDGRLRFAETQIVRHHPVYLRISAGEHNRAGRTAHGDVGVGAFEADALAGQAVDVGRLNIGIARDAHGGGAHLIGQQEEDVRALRGGSVGGPCCKPERAGTKKAKSKKVVHRLRRIFQDEEWMV